jgi:glycosyltransferase involved in cell wall biosynthesis
MAYQHFLSIVVPFHNSLGKCEELLGNLADLRPEDSVELVFVDDASTDLTVARLRDFAAGAKVPVRVVEIAHGGAGAARNAGFDHSSGEFVWFVDSDDAIDCEAVRLLDRAQCRNVDVIVWNYHYPLYPVRRFPPGIHVITHRPGPSFSPIMASWVSADFLRSTGIRAPDRCYFEDELVSNFLLPMFVRKFLMVDFVAYAFRLTEQSMSRGVSHMGAAWSDRLASARIGMTYIHGQALDAAGRHELEARFTQVFLWYSVRLSKLPGPTWLHAMRVMRQYREDTNHLDFTIDPFSVYPGRVASKTVARLLWWLSSMLPSQAKHFAALRAKLWDSEVGWQPPLIPPPAP